MEAEVHHSNPDDVVLNCAQMRDAEHFSQFRLALPAIDRNIAIHEGALREFEERRLGKKPKQTNKEIGGVIPVGVG